MEAGSSNLATTYFDDFMYIYADSTQAICNISLLINLPHFQPEIRDNSLTNRSICSYYHIYY